MFPPPHNGCQKACRADRARAGRAHRRASLRVRICRERVSVRTAQAIEKLELDSPNWDPPGTRLGSGVRRPGLHGTGKGRRSPGAGRHHRNGRARMRRHAHDRRPLDGDAGGFEPSDRGRAADRRCKPGQHDARFRRRVRCRSSRGAPMAHWHRQVSGIAPACAVRTQGLRLQYRGRRADRRFHRDFQNRLGVASIHDLASALDDGARVSDGSGFEARNAAIAAPADGVMAYTFGPAPMWSWPGQASPTWTPSAGSFPQLKRHYTYIVRA